MKEKIEDIVVKETLEDFERKFHFILLVFRLCQDG